MADESSKTVNHEYTFCSVCRVNHDRGRKHIFEKKHKKNLQNILTNFLKKVDEVKKFLHKPSVEDGELEPGARFWCHFCAENVDKHVTDRSVSIGYGGVFEHFASENHQKNLHSYWWQHGADNKLKKKFIVGKQDFVRFKGKVDEALQEFETQLEQKRQKEAQKIKQRENKQAETSQQPPTVQAIPHVVYKTVQNESGILQNPTGWDDGIRVWGGGIFKYRNHSNDQWFPWIMDLEDELPKSSRNEGTTASQGIQTAAAHSETLTCIGLQELQEGEGNVHSGATPPWLRDDDLQDESKQEVIIGPSHKEFKKHTERLKKANMNPNRVGANFDRTKETSDDWLPSFGRVWNQGPRWQSRHEFKGESRGRKNKS